MGLYQCRINLVGSVQVQDQLVALRGAGGAHSQRVKIQGVFLLLTPVLVALQGWWKWQRI